MRESSEKVATTGPQDFEQCMPLTYSGTRSSAVFGRQLWFGCAALVIGAILMFCGAIGAFYLWKGSDRSVYNVRYSMSINGKVKEGTMEIDSDNNFEKFRTGSGSDEAVEIHDFHIGITGIHFSGGQKCYIKSQVKASLPDVDSFNKQSLMFDLTEEIMPVKFDEESLIWMAAAHPLKDTSFLSTTILNHCGGLPIFWLQPTYHKDGERRKRDAQRAKRQFDMEEFEAAAEETNMAGHAGNSTPKTAVEDEGGLTSAVGSGFNPDNPYHRGQEGDEGTMTFDPMLDHLGICCAECRRSYTHCQRICEPLGGHWPWPYNYGGCQVACRVILPCRWWIARILGIL